MRLPASILAAVTAIVMAMPATAQDNLITLGAFVTVRAEHVPDFEQQVREHNGWHASQSDPQPWATYQALTGHGEYALLAPGMTWASLDAPALDMGADIAHWAESAARYTETEEFVLDSITKLAAGQRDAGCHFDFYSVDFWVDYRGTLK